jgi:predicted negative regulator of RcsB-dependent stress response
MIDNIKGYINEHEERIENIIEIFESGINVVLCSAVIVAIGMFVYKVFGM